MYDGLDIERFRHFAECYGANIDCWPQEIRQAAQLTARLPEARDIIAGEKRSISRYPRGRSPLFLTTLKGRSAASQLRPGSSSYAK